MGMDTGRGSCISGPNGRAVAVAGGGEQQVNQTRWSLSHSVSFWLLAALLTLLLFDASAPSPLYLVYQAMWHFPPITLTAVYAAYALGGLATLLTTGRLSDHLGRRPVLLLALAIQIVGMLAFVDAHDVGMLYLGRILQGLATGIGIGAISAWLLDLQPPDSPRLGSLVGGITPDGRPRVGGAGLGPARPVWPRSAPPRVLAAGRRLRCRACRDRRRAGPGQTHPGMAAVAPPRDRRAGAGSIAVRRVRPVR